MDGRPKRNILHIDYNIYNKTGERVPKEESEVDPVDKLVQTFSGVSIGMAEIVKLKRNTSVLSSKIEEFQYANDLSTFDEIDEVKQFVSEANILKQELIERHTDLKLELSEHEYEIYKNMYTVELEGLRKCIKKGTGLRKQLEREGREGRERKEREGKEEIERKEKEEKKKLCIASMEKIIKESIEFRKDNEFVKVSKPEDLKQYLLEARSLKVRLIHKNIDSEKILSEVEYEVLYRGKYSEELKQLEDYIFRGNNMKDDIENKLDESEASKIREKVEKEERERKAREEKEERERKEREEREDRRRKEKEEKEQRERKERVEKEERKSREKEEKEERERKEREDREERKRKEKEEKEERVRMEREDKEEKERKGREEKEETQKKEREESERLTKEVNDEHELKVVESKYKIEEIESLMDDMKDVIRITSWSKLDDVQIMGRKKRVYETNSKYNDLRDKLEKISEFMPPIYPDRAKIIPKLWQNFKALGSEQKSYVKNFEDEILKRGITNEMMNNTRIDVKLQKFTGYDSDIDIFSFQSEFEELVYGKVENRLLPRLLKNNYLGGSALTLVKNIDTTSEIWNMLKQAFGNPEELLRNKIREVEDLGPVWKMREPEKLVEALSKLVNAMIELRKMAEKHGIENDLYHGRGIGIIINIIGNNYQRKFYSDVENRGLSKKDTWNSLIKFLGTLLELEKILALDSKRTRDKSEKGLGTRKTYINKSLPDQKLKCHICDKDDHVGTLDHRGQRVIQYFSCQKFVEMKPIERYKLLQDKGLCCQCLNPGELKDSGRHKDGKCYNRYVCKNRDHLRYPRKKHVFVCGYHEKDTNNKELLELYFKEKIGIHKNLPQFTKGMLDHASVHLVDVSPVNEVIQKPMYIAPSLRTPISQGTTYKSKGSSEISTSKYDDEGSIYMLQTIRVGNMQINLFFDTGCSELVSKRDAILNLEKINSAGRERDGPIVLGGVGNQKTICQYGIYKVKLPLYNGGDAVMSGPCIDHVTTKFPMYPLNGRVRRDIYDAYRSQGGKVIDLPRLPEEVGGATDIMIGIKYLKYFPEAIFKLPSGLTIYKSPFVNPDGTRGVVGGPHQVFTYIEKYCARAQVNMDTHFVEQVRLVRMGYLVNPDIHLLGYKGTKDAMQDQLLFHDSERESILSTTSPDDNIVSTYANRQLKLSKLIDRVENAGTEVSYRCINCRNCNDCKSSGQIEYISIQEEFEQNVINKSVHVDIDKGITIAKLPFIVNPENKLNPNKTKALKVYNSQIRRLDKNQKEKEDVITSEKKLQAMGFVDFLENLSSSQQAKINESKIQYYIPWRAVWNMNSLSTPCRLVFDASLTTSSGFSLNSIIAKGRNNMNKLVEIMIRWLLHKFAYHTDIQKMYNTVRLAEEDWCYQLYLWDNELNERNEPSVKVIKTLIYGVRSSGNQAERGLRETARLMKDEFPRVNEVVQNDIYVDDCMSGEDRWENVLGTTDNLKLALNRGGFALKGFTFSGKNPPSNLSSDGVTISVGGMNWLSKEDCISLDTSNLNFDHKTRGKKSADRNNQIPKEFTRRDCVGKVAEVFDLLGKATPIMSRLKYDLRALTLRKLDWDHKIPNDLQALWVSNFEMIKDLGNVKFRRAIVPEDAISLEIDTIDTGDATQSLICSAIYARFKRKNGEYSCQLVFARSKLVPEGTTLPRSELLAACLNATTGHVVKLSFRQHHKRCIKLTDSQVVLHWINNTEGALKQWVRNRVIEINRLDDKTLWRYVSSKNMIADLGTKTGARIRDINDNSPWINGYDWMRLEPSEFPVKTVEEIKLDNKDLTSAYDEAIYKENVEDLIRFDWPTHTCHDKDVEIISSFVCKKKLPEEMNKRLEFSQYIVDPNRFRFRKVIRVVALVILFIKKLKQKTMNITPGNPVVKDIRSNISKGVLHNLPQDYRSTEYLVTSGKRHRIRQTGIEMKCKEGLVVLLTDVEIGQALDYYFRKATLEIKEFVDKKAYEGISNNNSGILHYTGRILPTQEFGGNTEMSDVMLDLSSTTFYVPLVDQKSPLAYSIINEVHWHNKVARHSGVETVLRYAMKYAYIIGGRDLVKIFRKACIRCRILAKRTIDVSMGPISKHNLTIAPAFYISQVDIFGPFLSYSSHNKRATVKVWFLVFCCCTTGAVSIKLMENYSTSSFMLAFIRFSCNVGYPKILLPDEGSQLVKGCKDMLLCFHDVKQKLSIEYGVEYNTCPVGAHYMHGKVERKIRSVQESMSKMLQHNRLSIIEWETLGDEIANCVNDLPLATGNVVSDLENLDILTPNRLMKGRNNDRSPSGPLYVCGKPDKIMESNFSIFRTWYECWIISHVPKLMDQPKWFTSDRDVKVGDIVLFKKTDKEYSGTYQYGMIKSLSTTRDGKTRAVTVEYMNHNENMKRTSTRGIRDLVMIHPVDELNIFQELGEIATIVDMQKRLADSYSLNNQ